MIRKTLILATVISACAFVARAEFPVSFRYDFNNGIPEEIRLVDNDGNEPSADVAAYGFTVGNPWLNLRADDSHVRCAASTSWYKTPATSDDWMILPAVRIVSGDVTLSWEARAHDDVLSDGYEIYVSDSGCEISDFKKLDPFFSCAGEKAEWTTHSLSLAAFAGKDVYIAFVNNSTDKALLYIDNIAVDENKQLSLGRFFPELLKTGETLRLAGTISNNTDQDIQDASLKLSIGGEEYVMEDRSMVIPARQSSLIEMNTEFTSGEMARFPYFLSVSAGEYTATQEGMILSACQNVLMEEGTGTWCMWCPKGAVEIERLKGKYPDTFIPVAVHNGDPMVVEGYSVYTNSGYPVCVANRIDRLRGNPDNMEDIYLEAAAKEPAVGIAAQGEYNAAGSISLSADIAFAREYIDSRFAMQYIVIENNVHKIESGYSQRNQFSGGNVPMGGYENLPDPVPASQMWYQEVARMITGDESGIAGSIPAYIAAGEPIHHDYQLTLSDNIIDKDQLRVIAVVIDTKTGEIVNSAYVPVKGIASIPGISTSGAPRIQRHGSLLRVLSESATESVAIISLAGNIVCENYGSDSIDISGCGHGVFIIRIKTNGEYHYYKQAI